MDPVSHPSHAMKSVAFWKNISAALSRRGEVACSMLHKYTEEAKRNTAPKHPFCHFLHFCLPCVYSLSCIRARAVVCYLHAQSVALTYADYMCFAKGCGARITKHLIIREACLSIEICCNISGKARTYTGAERELPQNSAKNTRTQCLLNSQVDL